MYAAIVLAAATGSPQASIDPCNRVAQAETVTSPPIPAALKKKYPDGASVRLIVDVDENGKVTNAGVWGTPPDPALATAAQAAAKKFMFTPTTVNCTPIADRLLTTVTFSPPQ
jgi:TonB family protein